MLRNLLTWPFVALMYGAWAQSPGPLWDARWIGHPTASPVAYGVFHFRRSFDLAEVPDSLPVYVSADNRYKLYLNGALVGIGPARGDLLHWRYERLDLRPFLRPGRNVLAATVWNFGADRPAAQVSLETGFILQAGAGFGDSLNTSDRWQVLHDRAYAPERNPEFEAQTYAVVGPGDRLEAPRYPWGWKTARDLADEWLPPRLGPPGQAPGYGTDGGRFLVPREIPNALPTVRPWGEVVALSTPGRTGRRVPSDTLRVPAGSAASYLVICDTVTTGYPGMRVSGGRGGQVTVTYAEALVDAGGEKGHRDSLRGKRLVGYRDVFVPDGKPGRTFETLWWRTMRFAELRLEAGEEDLLFYDLSWRPTGYPLPARARLEAGAPWVDSLWRVGWRTAQLCAHETYVDCPYYEQLQYAGDTRIQALISLYGNGDDRLARRAILDFYASALSLGLTQSRYPSSKLQVIPPYSLFWVAMVYDYHQLVGDAALVARVSPVIERALAWHADRLNERDLLAHTAWWNFVDWTEEWPWDNQLRVGGVPPQTADGDNATLTLQYAYVLRLASELFRQVGRGDLADRYERQRRALVDAALEHCYDEARGLIAELPGVGATSEHAQAMLVLAADSAQLARVSALTEAMRTADDFPGTIEATMYYRFYLAEALVRIGAGDRYVSTLGPWREMLALGLTTFAEKPEPTRSDVHAWSASPNYHLLSVVAGIRPAAPGFAEVIAEPQLGELTSIAVRMPHPAGFIELEAERGEGGISAAELRVPPGVPARLRLRGRDYLVDAAGHVAIDFE